MKHEPKYHFHYWPKQMAACTYNVCKAVTDMIVSCSHANCAIVIHDLHEDFSELFNQNFWSIASNYFTDLIYKILVNEVCRNTTCLNYSRPSPSYFYLVQIVRPKWDWICQIVISLARMHNFGYLFLKMRAVRTDIFVYESEMILNGISSYINIKIKNVVSELPKSNTPSIKIWKSVKPSNMISAPPSPLQFPYNNKFTWKTEFQVLFKEFYDDNQSENKR